MIVYYAQLSHNSALIVVIATMNEIMIKHTNTMAHVNSFIDNAPCRV